jgi:hypothetical protein
MLALQLACFLIVASWVALRLRREDDKGAFLVKLAVIAAAAWVGEESCIRLYGFYAYSPSWSAFIDRVPLAIVFIWPIVILSSMDLARGLMRAAGGGNRRRLRTAIVVMLLVIADASLIEPIAVKSGLWRWTEPGPFDVPVIGVLGWGFFAFGASLALSPRGAAVAPVLLAGPLAAHALLLGSWWLALRWLPRGTEELPFVLAAGAASAALTVLVVKERVTLGRADLLLRVPAALFFFALLGLYGREDTALVLYALAFAPPYLALTWTAFSSRASLRAA